MIFFPNVNNKDGNQPMYPHSLISIFVIAKHTFSFDVAHIPFKNVDTELLSCEL